MKLSNHVAMSPYTYEIRRLFIRKTLRLKKKMIFIYTTITITMSRQSVLKSILPCDQKSADCATTAITEVVGKPIKLPEWMYGDAMEHTCRENRISFRTCDATDEKEFSQFIVDCNTKTSGLGVVLLTYGGSLRGHYAGYRNGMVIFPTPGLQFIEHDPRQEILRANPCFHALTSAPPIRRSETKVEPQVEEGYVTCVYCSAPNGLGRDDCSECGKDLYPSMVECWQCNQYTPLNLTSCIGCNRDPLS